MDEDTERLRDIFVDVAGEEEVTERQEASRGSILDQGPDEEAAREVIEEMRERYDFRSSLPPEDLLIVASGFYEGESDAEIAGRIDADRGAVRRARIDLHLVTGADREAPFDADDIAAALRAHDSIEAVADALDADPETVHRYRHVQAIDEERRLVADRFRNELERLLGEGDLATRLTDDVKESGLEEAAEDIETDVSF